jgi:hypothetical protein
MKTLLLLPVLLLACAGREFVQTSDAGPADSGPAACAPGAGCSDSEVCPGTGVAIVAQEMCGWPGTIAKCPAAQAGSGFWFVECSCGGGAFAGGQTIAYWRSTDPVICEIDREFWLAARAKCK